MRRIPYLSNLPIAQEAILLSRASTRAYETGAVLFLEGEDGAGLFIMLTGLVKIVKTSPDGREQVLRYMGPGDSFNEVPAFDGGVNPASAVAIETAEVVQLPRSAVLEMLASSPEFARVLVETLGQRLRHLVALVEDLSFRQVTGRVARVLYQAVQPHEGVGAGAANRKRLTQREIGEMAGSSREVVARALKVLEDGGAIEVRRTTIEVIDPSKLLSFP